MKLNRGPLEVTLLLALLAPTLGAAEKVMVGFLHREATQHRAEWRDYRYRQALVEAGMDGSLVENSPLFHGKVAEEAFLASLKPFNAIVLVTSEEGVYNFAELKATCEAVRRVLERYVSDGGGLFVLLQPHRYPNSDDETYFNHLLASFGCAFLHEGTFDPERVFKAPKTLCLPQWDYFWTANIKPHPATEGVQRLYLPKLLFERPGVAAFKLDGPWTAVVAGEASAKSFVQHKNDNLPDWAKPATYASAPPIAAVRELGKGRVFVYAAPEMHVFGNFGNRIWPHIVETEGDAEARKPSHGNRLVTNALRWLGQPSLAIEGFGTYRDTPPEPIVFPQSIDWDKYQFAPAAKPDTYGDGVPITFPEAAVGVKGVIGAHTALTDGQGTVADYVAAAKKAGLKFIVFAEPLEQLTPEELEKLKTDCAAASKDPDFIAMPGIEYTDSLGNRWAAWGEKIIFPPADFEYRDRKYTLWDGQRIHLTGHYEHLCGFRPNALIDYKTLAQGPSHPANMWWFFRVFPFAYDVSRDRPPNSPSSPADAGRAQGPAPTIADNFEAWLYSLRDLRWMDPASFTRVKSPAQVAEAAATCVTVLRSVETARQWLDSRCASSFLPARPYVTQGPLILSWEGLNTQMEQPVEATRGIQRVRLRFEVASPDGIREVRIHDANFGVIRRFLGGGAKQLARELEMVHDKQHFLTLEILDTQGRRAVSRYLLLSCHKSGLYRCGDNLNTLSSSSMTWHPDRAEMPLAKHHEDIGRISLAGFDTSSGVASQPNLWRLDFIRTAERPPEYPAHGQGAVNKTLDVQLTSHDLQIFRFQMDHLIEGWDNEKRPNPALSSIPRKIGDLELFERTHTCYGLRSRTNYFLKWNHRREFEGTKDYRGGIIWHEGQIRFKKDLTLRGTVPIPLVVMDGPGGVPYRQFDHLFVTDRDRGALGIGLTIQDKVHQLSGRIAPGGYVAAMPTDVGYYALLTSSDSDFAYDSQDWDRNLAKFGWVFIGLGRDGQKVKAGDVIPYRFMLATLNDRRVSNELLEDMRRAYNLDGGRDGYPLTVKHGKLVDAQFFLTIEAEGGETLLDLGPREMICDLPIRVRGIEDNGCAAVCSSRNSFHRFIAVSDGTAWLQESMEKPVTLWIGNVFFASDKRLKLTLIVHGQAPGKPPFLEVHNPTGGAIRATVTSPPHTPLFGGFRREVEVPPGAGLRINDLK
jgi:hypothetical protein